RREPPERREPTGRPERKTLPKRTETDRHPTPQGRNPHEPTPSEKPGLASSTAPPRRPRRRARRLAGRHRPARPTAETLDRRDHRLLGRGHAPRRRRRQAHARPGAARRAAEGRARPRPPRRVPGDERPAAGG